MQTTHTLGFHNLSLQLGLRSHAIGSMVSMEDLEYCAKALLAESVAKGLPANILVTGPDMLNPADLSPDWRATWNWLKPIDQIYCKLNELTERHTTCR